MPPALTSPFHRRPAEARAREGSMWIDLPLRRRRRATASTFLTHHHVPDFTAFAVILGVEARPLVLRAVACSFLVGRLVLAAFVAAVVSATSHERHFGQVDSAFDWTLGYCGVWG